MKLLNNTNEKIINLGCHVQVIHLKPHKILTHMLIDFLILRVIFIGMRCRFRFFCIVIPDLIWYVKRKSILQFVLYRMGVSKICQVKL